MTVKMLQNLSLGVLALGALSGSLVTTEAKAQGLAVMFDQPTGLGPQPVPTSPNAPYYPQFSNVGGQQVAYAATTTTFGAASAPTDVLCLLGNATTVERLTKVVISGTQTTQAAVPAQLILRTTLDAGGTTTTAPVITRIDSADTAASATLALYTANAGTLGAAGSPLASSLVSLASAGAAGAPGSIAFDFIRQAKQPTVRGVAQELCVNFAGATMTGNALTISMEWTEAAQ